MAFTPNQLTQYNRLSPERQAELTLSKLERFSPDELRARVNIISVSNIILWSPENDYTTAEQEYIEAVFPRSKWAIQVPIILAEAKQLELEGISTSLIMSILRGRRV